MAKKAKVRPFEEGDARGVGQLRVRAFPYLPEVKELGFYDGVYRWLGAHPLAGEIHRWVAATEDGEIMGHLAATPLYYRVNGRRVVAHSPGDYMGHPDYGFHALMLMRKFFSTCENCVSLDMVPEVIGVQSKFGAVDAGQLQYAAKLLNVSRLPMPGAMERLLNPAGQASLNGHPSPEGMEQPPEPEGYQPPRSRAPIPGPVKGLMNGGLRLMDEALGGAFAGGPKVVTVQHFDDSFDAFFEKVAAGVSCVVEKDAAFLRWRYGPGSPQSPVTVLVVQESGGLAGYAVVRTVSSGQDGYVFDLVALPGRRDVVRALLQESVRLLREAGAHIIRYRFAESATGPRSPDLLRLGFFHRHGRRNTLMTKFADEVQHERATSVARWSYNIGDGEATFWLR
jgi:hypothetical protein